MASISKQYSRYNSPQPGKVECCCRECGAKYFRYPSQIGSYCSQECKARSQQQNIATLFWSKVKRAEGCWLWQAGCFPSGHGQFHIRRKPVKAHRVAYELTYGPIPQGQWVLHRCDNPPCVNPEHLYLGNHGDNTRDMVDRERSARGERQHLARLTEAQVRDIRQRFAEGASCRGLAREFGVHPKTIRAVVRRITWKHLT